MFGIDIFNKVSYIMGMSINIALKVAILASKHKTQVAVAEQVRALGLSFSVSYLAKIVQGHRRTTPRIRKALAQVLEVSEEVLFRI